MEWLWGAALAPLVVCGLMCGVPMLFVALGLRRRNQHLEDGYGGGPARDEAPEPLRESSNP